MASPLIKAFDKRLQHPWLTSASDLFYSTFEHTRASIQSHKASLSRPPVALICEPQAEKFLGNLLACIADNAPVFITNPQWQQPQWDQVASQMSPDLILGDHPCLKKYPKIEYKLTTPGPIMIPTGGSAGNIKFAIHTWSTLTAATQSLCNFLQTETLHACCTLPLYHVSGLMQAIRTFVTGGQLDFVKYTELPHAVLPPHDKTYTISLVPTQLQRLLDTPSSSAALKQFDVIFIGGAAAQPPTLQAARQLRIPVMLSYGTTETAAMIAAMPGKDYLPQQPIAGKLLPGVKINIKRNQIMVHSPSLCHGIYPDLFPQHTFWATGDEGYLDQTGKLVVLGRLDRLINTGGEKIDPKAVATALLNTGLIEACMVVPKADLDWGHIAVAIYVPAPSWHSRDHLITTLQGAFPSYQVPKAWIEVTALPLTHHGKPDHKMIQKLLSTF